MKAKVNRGDGFRGVLDYALNSEKRPEIIGGTIAGLNARQLAAEFGMVRKLRPDAKRPVWHCSLSLPPGDHLTGERWDAVAGDFLKEMGFSDKTPWVAIRHRDTDKDHIHIIASRIDLDGKLWHGKWEARTAIEATQKLEKSHGLRLTPGLENSSGRKALKKGEIEMSLRKEEQPPKLKLQAIIDEALSSGELTAVQFAEALALSGVEVKANLASTGTFNGFSYEIDGIAFKGSKLGKSYGWSGIKERGVTYEQDRDYTSLARFAAASAGASHQSVVGESGTDRPDPRDIRPDNRSTTPIDSSACGSDQPASDQLTTTATADVERQDRHTEQHLNKGGEGGRIFGESPEINIRVSMESTQRSPGNSEATLEATINSSGVGSDAGQRPNPGWNARFKAASAKSRDKRRAGGGTLEQSNSGRARITNGDLQAVKQTDPRPFIERMGYTVKKDGQRHFSIRHGKDEAYRLTQKPDSTWVWVDKYGTSGGDNIDLVRELTGLDRFIDCVYELNGGLRATPALVQAPVAPKPPRIPPESSTGRIAGRMYLNDRGISDDSINHAEQSGFLRYLADGLLFVGYQAGQIWNATKRSIMPDAEIPKRDLAGSDKSKPQVLTGNPKTLWIVEGGVDALALHDIAKRSGKEPPTVIVSGGAGVLSFFDNPEIAEKIRAASVVVVAKDNEKDADTQAKTDAQHARQVGRARDLNPGAQVVDWKPQAPEIKDIAELNEYQQRPVEPVRTDFTREVKHNDREM
ncbi:MAG: relaxase/mobilization nuclease domain-containing protein [Methyloprofundus sp.]|nr:relaxase/mobilization nuclease domain-containing protein [Methyloprofundus sp.]MBE0470700.1 relaxase/mobilization nuclease domain-containing protein [Methyloprofundus sp.]